MSKKSITITFFLLLLILGGVFYFLRLKQQKEPPPPSPLKIFSLGKPKPKPKTFKDLIVNSDFEKAPSAIGRLLKKQHAIKGWRASKDVRASINENPSYVSSGKRSLLLEASEGAGITQEISPLKNNLFKISVKVFAVRGGARLTVQDKEGNVIGEATTSKSNEWEDLEIVLLPSIRPKIKRSKKQSYFGVVNKVFAQKEEGQFTIQIEGISEDDTFYVDDVGIALAGGSGEVCDPEEATSCLFYEYCDTEIEPSSCQYDVNWADNLTEEEAKAIYKRLTTDMEISLPSIVKWAVSDIGEIQNLFVGVGPAAMCAPTVCGPVSHELYEQTSIEAILRGFYPELSDSEIDILEQKMQGIKLSRASGATFELLMFTCNVEVIFAGGGPCTLLFNKVSGFLDRLIPAYIKQGAGTFLTRGGELIKINTTRLANYIRLHSNAAWSAPLFKEEGEGLITSLAKKFPQLQGLELTTYVGQGKAFLASDVGRLGDGYLQVLEETWSYLRRYGVEPQDLVAYVAVTVEDYASLNGRTVENVMRKGAEAFVVYMPEYGRKVIVFNPSFFITAPRSKLLGTFKHEGLHVALRKAGGRVIINSIAFDKTRAFWFEEFLTAVLSRSGYSSDITMVQNKIVELASSPTTRERLINAFNWRGEHGTLYDYLIQKEIPEALERIVSYDYDGYMRFSNKWLEAIGEHFHDWLLNKIYRLPVRLDYLPQRFSSLMSWLQRKIIPIVYARFICEADPSDCEAPPTPRFNTVLMRTTETLEELGIEELSADWLATIMRTSSLGEKLDDGQLTRNEVDQTIEEQIDITSQNPQRITLVEWEENSWGNPSLLETTPEPSLAPAFTPTPTPLPQFSECGACSRDAWGGCTPPEECRLINDYHICVEENGKPGVPCCLHDKSCKPGFEYDCGYASQYTYCNKCKRYQDSKPWCSERWQTDCGAGAPAKARLKNPKDGAALNSFSPITFSWLAFGEGKSKKCGEKLPDKWAKWQDCSGKWRWGSPAKCIPETSTGGATDRNCWGYACARGSFEIYPNERFYAVFVKEPGEADFRQVCTINNIPNPQRVGDGIPPEFTSCQFTPTKAGSYQWFLRAGYSLNTQGGIYTNYTDSDTYSFTINCPFHSVNQLRLNSREGPLLTEAGFSDEGFKAYWNYPNLTPQPPCSTTSGVQEYTNSQIDYQTGNLPFCYDNQAADVRLETPQDWAIEGWFCDDSAGTSGVCPAPSGTGDTISNHNVTCGANYSYGWILDKCNFDVVAEIRDENGNVLQNVPGFSWTNSLSGSGDFPSTGPVRVETHVRPLDKNLRGQDVWVELSSLPKGWKIVDTFCENNGEANGCPDSIGLPVFKIENLKMDCELDYTYGWKVKPFCYIEDLTCGTPDYTSIPLSWRVVSPEAGDKIRVFRGNSMIADDLPTTTTTYTDTGLSCHEGEYQYKVYCIKGSGGPGRFTNCPIARCPTPTLTPTPTPINTCIDTDNDGPPEYGDDPFEKGHTYEVDWQGNKLNELWDYCEDELTVREHACVGRIARAITIGTTSCVLGRVCVDGACVVPTPTPTPTLTPTTAPTFTVTPTFALSPTPTNQYEPTTSPTPTSIPTADAFPQVSQEQRLKISLLNKDGYFELLNDGAFLKKGGVLKISFGGEDDVGLEEASLYYKRKSAEDTGADDPSLGWVQIYLKTCKPPCKDFETLPPVEFTLPDNLEPGDYIIAASLWDHVSPIAGQHFGTTGYVPKSLRQESLKCDPESSTYCLKENLLQFTFSIEQPTLTPTLTSKATPTPTTTPTGMPISATLTPTATSTPKPTVKPTPIDRGLSPILF